MATRCRILLGSSIYTRRASAASSAHGGVKAPNSEGLSLIQQNVKKRGLSPIHQNAKKRGLSPIQQLASKIQLQDRVEDGFRDVDEEAAVDLVGGIRRLVVIGMILDAKIHKRDFRRMKRAVIRLV